MAGTAQPKTGGRTKGTPNKLNAEIRAMVLEALSELGGVDYLVEVGRKKPEVLCGLIARLIPSEIKASEGLCPVPCQ